MRDYIDAHLADRFTLTDLAGVACLSPYHFSGSFKLALGIGPQRYVMRCRARACQDADAQDHRPLAWAAGGGWFRRPEPSDLRLSPRDRYDTRPISRCDEVSLIRRSDGQPCSSRDDRRPTLL